MLGLRTCWQQHTALGSEGKVKAKPTRARGWERPVLHPRPGPDPPWGQTQGLSAVLAATHPCSCEVTSQLSDYKHICWERPVVEPSLYALLCATMSQLGAGGWGKVDTGPFHK